jgi:hypothetical protein
MRASRGAHVPRERCQQDGGMRRALLLTAYDRVQYLERVVASWRAVPTDGWHLRVAVEPGAAQEAVLAALAPLPFADLEVVVNERRLGVAENPYRHLSALFDAGFDFVARTEDDLVVADDVLRLLDHCAARYADDPGIATAGAYSAGPADVDPALLLRTAAFSPWLWGTWRDRWSTLIGPTWDRDYTTWNGSPGFESGWDWNLNTRVLPAHGLEVVAPAASRVQNIGVVGQHGTAGNHETAASFRASFGPVAYVE